MKTMLMVVMVISVVACFGFQILGLMNLIPIYITSPPLFISLLIFLLYLNGRNKFRGFQ